MHKRVVAVLDAALREELGLTLEAFDVLVTLGSSPQGRLRMQPLADALLVSKSSCTRLVDRLARRGLVRRADVPGDRRGVEAVLTEDGRRHQRRAALVHLRALQLHFGQWLSDDDVTHIRRALAQVPAGDVDPEAETRSRLEVERRA